MKIERVKLDSKGRIVLPASFRNSLSLNENDYAYAALNEDNSTVVISTKPKEKLFELKIELGDEPGSLAKLAKVLSDFKVDLVSTESHSIERTKTATWRVTCSFEGNWQALTSKLKENGAKSVTKKSA